MKRIALAAALLAVLGSIVPASAEPLPTDTNPLGVLKSLPAGTDQTPAPGVTRLIVEFAGDMEAKGAFGAKFSGVLMTATGPRVPSLVGYSDNIGDAGEATAETPATQVFAGLYGDVGSGATCPPNTKPQLWAYSITRTETRTEPEAAYSLSGCETGSTVITGSPGTRVFTTTVTKWTPGFWLDFTGLPTSEAPTAMLFQYSAVYGSAPSGGAEFYEPGASDAGGTSTLLDAPGV